jgi:predicted NACHT family NTPase
MLDKVVDALIGELVSKVLDKLQYSEIRLRLLKQFNLIPDTPPNDFEGVYVYTLIEYGVGKEKVILQLFKETEIKEEFGKAFSQNKIFNTSILDNFIQSSDIGDKIKDQKIYYRRELTEFARLFVEIAKRARTATEILQDHKLDKIENSLQDLQEIKNQLAELAQSQQPLLPPGEIVRETELAKQLKKWFETLGYKFENYEVLEKEYFEWIINILHPLGGYYRILIHGVEAEAGINDINAVKTIVETQKVDQGWIVAPRRVSKAARETVEKSEKKQIFCYTFDELIEKNADFNGYFNWLETEVKSRGIDKYYVPLACTKEEINPHKQRIGISHYGKEDDWIEGYINQWLDDPVKEHLSVLGEFGTRKRYSKTAYSFSDSFKRLC